MRSRGLAAVLISLVVLGSCRKSAGTFWDVDVVLPLVNSHLSISNFVSDTLVTPDAEGLLHVKVNREIGSLLLDSLLDVPTTTFRDTLKAPFDATLTAGQEIPFLEPSEVRFEIGNGAEIVLADIKSAMVTVQFTNEVSEPLDLIYRIPSATKDGNTFEVRETIYPGTDPLVKSYDLSGYRLNMRGQKGNSYNTIVQAYTVALNPAVPKVTVPSGKGILIEVGFSGIVPQYIEGYFGQSMEEIAADTVSLGIIRNFDAENFMLSEANMVFTILNEFGADFIASLTGITSINSRKNTSVQLTHPKLSRFTLNWPTRTGDAVKASTTTIVFNSGNSSIVPFISNLPDKISYQGSVTINPPPAGNDVGHTNYAYYGTGIRILADIDIPMRFSADRFRLESVTETDFSDVTQLDKVKDGNFIVSVTNGFPFDATVQVYLRDEFGVVMDSLLTSGTNVVKGGMVDGNNKVTVPVKNDILVPATPQKISSLKKAKSMKVKAVVTLPPHPPAVPIYDSYSVDVNIRAEMLYNVGIN